MNLPEHQTPGVDECLSITLCRINLYNVRLFQIISDIPKLIIGMSMCVANYTENKSICDL